MLAGLLTLGIALEKSGAAALVAKMMVTHIGPWGSLALLAPIAIVAAESQGWSARPFLMAVTFGASLSFMTPIGYQTNTLIYGPGQYKFSDFVRVGTPLNIIFWLLCTWLIPKLWPF